LKENIFIFVLIYFKKGNSVSVLGFKNGTAKSVALLLLSGDSTGRGTFSCGYLEDARVVKSFEKKRNTMLDRDVLLKCTGTLRRPHWISLTETRHSAVQIYTD
jgi:hypothetical protein